MSKDFKFDTRKNYILHIVLIVLTLFILYFIGNALLNFQGRLSLIKMFIWFCLGLYFSDHLWEWVLGV